MTDLINKMTDVQTEVTTLTNTGRDGIAADSAVTIELEHHEIHLGNSFTLTAITELAGSLSISFKTGTTKRIHITVGYASESKAHLEHKEKVTITATTGTEQIIYNRDRNSSLASTVLQNKSGVFVADNKVLIDATTTDGTVVTSLYNWGDKKIGAYRRGLMEYILLEDTEYEFLLTSDDGNKGLHLDLNWYEI